MPNLSQHPSSDIVKLLAIGDSMSGKTGSLVSLVPNFSLRILDTDNKLDILRYQIEAHCPERLSSVEYRTLRDKTKAGPSGAIIDGRPQAWINTIKMLDNWRYDDVDLGVPGTWGPDCILVIDSLSRLCDAAYDFHETIIPKSRSGDYDGRAIYGNAQDDVEKLLGMLTSPTFNTNVIVIAHGVYMDLPDGTKKIFPQGVGQKLSPKIPQYFPNVVYYTNRSGKRTIQLDSTPMVDVATARPNEMPKTLPIESGLAEIFRVLREQPQKPTTKPVSPFTLKRA